MLVPVVLPEMITTRTSAQMEPYSHDNTGTLRKSINSPKEDRMPGKAAETQMMESSDVLNRHLLRTMR